MQKQNFKRIEELEQRIEKLERKEVARKAITSLSRAELFEHELVQLAVELDPEKHPKEKLNAIIAGLLLEGRLESKGIRRVSPPDDADAREPGMYQSLFQQLALNPKPAAEEPLKPDPDVRPLYPLTVQAGPPPVAPGAPLPVEGEAIDETPPAPGAPRRRRTIEL